MKTSHPARALTINVQRAVAAGLTAAALLTGCRGPAESGGSSRLTSAEKMMWSTYLVGTKKGAGAGIVVSMPGAASVGGTKVAIVTTAHLLETARKGPVFVALRVPDAEGNAEAAVLTYYPPRTSGKFYVRHPRHDVAAFSLDISSAVAPFVSFPTCLEFGELARPGVSLHAGDEVFFAGFPVVMPYLPGVFPILRSGRVASYPVGTPQVDDMFCIDADTHSGDSGAPVFPVRSGRRPRLAGMIVQRVESTANNGSHLAVAVHSKAISETLELLAARERRAAKTGIPRQ
jgi:hypothetical protein